MLKSFIKSGIAFILLMVTGISAKAQQDVISNCINFQWVLAVPSGNYVNGQQLIIWDFSDSLADQKFHFYRRLNGNYTIMPAERPNMAVAIPSGIIQQNQAVIIWESNNNLDQQWILENITGMKYIIRSCINRNYVLAPLQTAKGAAVVIQKYTGSEAQQWAVIPTNGTFYNGLFKEAYSK